METSAIPSWGLSVHNQPGISGTFSEHVAVKHGSLKKGGSFEPPPRDGDVKFHNECLYVVHEINQNGEPTWSEFRWKTMYASFKSHFCPRVFWRISSFFSSNSNT